MGIMLGTPGASQRPEKVPTATCLIASVDAKGQLVITRAMVERPPDLGNIRRETGTLAHYL
jgi:hypothetical protein